jgi:hypothetical protein
MDSEDHHAMGSENGHVMGSENGHAMGSEDGQGVDSEDGQAMLEHPAVQRGRMRESFYTAADATAKLLVEFEALIETLDGEDRDAAQSTAVQAMDTWRRILHHLERPALRGVW